jgi:preprotein translocase subunit SecF
MDILKNSRIYIIISMILVLISSYFLVFGKLNLGIDMTGGISMEYAYENDINIEEIKTQLNLAAEDINKNSQIINDTSVYSIT